jgi:tRNA A-37 threonylcarbamoyl transferase component Bud32
MQGVSPMTGVRLLEAIVRSKNVELVRQTKTRDVFRARLNGHEFYIKSFSNRNFVERIKRFLMGSSAEREYHVLNKLKELDIGAPQPVAFLESREQSILITHAIRNAYNLKSILASRGFDFHEKNKLLRNLASFVRRLHDAGYLHADLHAGNILVTLPEFEYSIIDSHNARFLRASQKHRLEQLAYLIFSLYTFFNKTDLVRFVRFYGIDDYRPILHLLKRLRLEYLRSREARCLVNSSEFVRGGWGLARRDADVKSMISLLESAKLLKKLDSREVYVTGNVFIKAFRSKHNDKALAIWKNSHALKLRRVATFKTYVYVSKPSYLPSYSGTCNRFVFGQWIEDSHSLTSFIKDVLNKHDAATRQDFIARAASFVRHMHDMGVFHKDLKAGNILVSCNKFYVIDLEDIVLKNSLALEDKIKNLAQLNAAVPHQISRSERLLFFYHYATPDLLRNRKRIISAIMKQTIERHHVWP